MAKSVNLNLTDELYAKLKAMAFSRMWERGEGRESMSTVVRELIDNAPDPDGKWYREVMKRTKARNEG